MSTLTPGRTGQDAVPAKPRRLRGLAWLLARQHRAALIVCAAVTVLGAAWIVYQRGAMLDSLQAAGWPTKPADAIDSDVRNRISNDLDSFGSNLAFLPLLLGVFLGAPLIASDQEQGTARLVTTQSVSRGHWLLWKLCFALALVAVTTGILSLFYAWWWRSLGPFAPADWLTGSLFDTTGPVLVATALCTTSLGIAIGALARRAVPAMAATFVASTVVLFVAGMLRDQLATPRRLTFPLDSREPAVLDGVVQVDQWIGTASGELYGWGTCVHETSPQACRADLGIVDSVWEYFGRDQMAGMQWTAAGGFLALTAVSITVFLWRTRRGPL
ncbi:ABC transporter permease [Streptomyces sp. NPDC003042]